MRMPGAKMLSKSKFIRRLARAQQLSQELAADFSDDEFIPLPKNKKVKHELVEFAPAISEGEIRA